MNTLVNYRIVVLLLTAVLTAGSCSQQKIQDPQPIDQNRHELRRQWIETIHRTAPGVDWRAMDDSVRWAKYVEKLPQLQAARPSGSLKSITGGFESIAGGVLTGQWTEKGSNNQSGRMHCVDIDYSNNLLYGASSGGNIWVGPPDGSAWTCLTDHKQVLDVQFLRVFANESGGTRILMNPRNRVVFYYSDDMGVTWNTSTGLSGYSQGGVITRGLSKPDGTIYLLINRNISNNHLVRSTDLGKSFQLVTRIDGTQACDIWTDRFAEGPVWYVDRSKVYQLTDENVLQQVGTVSINFAENEIRHVQLGGCAAPAQTHLYVMAQLEKSSRFFGSEDGGVSWTVRGDNHEGPFMTNSFGVSNIDPNLVGFGGVNAYASRDGARTWRAINTWGEYYGNVRYKLHADIPEIEFFLRPDGKEWIWISTDGGTYYSDDGLVTVNNVSLTNLNVSQYYSTYTNRDLTHIIYAGSQDQGFQRSKEDKEGTVSFQQTISGDYGHIVSADKGYSLWTVYPGFAMRYPDAVNSSHIVTWDFSGKNHFWMPPLMEDPYDPAKVYLAGGTSSTGNHLWLLTDRGSSVSVTELPFDFSGGNENHWISSMAYSPINKDYRYVLNSGGRFYFSSDRGTTWERSSSIGPGSHYFYGNTIVTSPVDINTIYIGGAGYSSRSVFVSRDGGMTFQGMSTGLPNTLVFEMKANEDGTLLFAATETGPYVYIQSEGKWFDLAGISAPDQTYWSVDYVPKIKTARFGTYGRGIWDFRIASYSSAGALHADNFMVNLYPNPADDRVYIATEGLFGQVEIEIVTLGGQLVMRESLGAGSGIHELGIGDLESGVYLVRILSGESMRVMKLVRR